MGRPERTTSDDTTTDLSEGGGVRALLVEVFLARGARHHDDLDEAAAELRELFACLDVLTEENEALIRRKVARLEARAGRARLRLVGDASAPDA